MRKPKSTPVLAVKTPDGDDMLVPANKAKHAAKKVANETGEPVTVRNHITGKVVATEQPDDLSIPAALDRTKDKTKEQIEAERDELIARDKRRDEAQRKLLSKTHTKQQETTMHTHVETETKKPARKAVKVATKKAAKPTKAAKTNGNGKHTTKAKAKVVGHRAEGPSGKVALIMKAAERKQGASRADLAKITASKERPEGWPASWKWFFTNKRGTGWAQRWGYKFEVIERPSGEVAYRITKNGNGKKH